MHDENRGLILARPEEVEGALHRILESRHFVHAPKKQKFLRLVCDFYVNGKAGELNEYLIGREVFDRNESYRPTEDPIVRVGAHDVRKKLDLYYQNEGAEDEVRLEIPVGSYEPIFLQQRPALAQTGSKDLSGAAPADAGEGKTGEVAPSVLGRFGSGPVFWIGAGLFAGLLLAVGLLLWSNFNLRRQLRGARAAIDAQAFAGPVWDPFLTSEAPTLLVLSNPVVYRLVNAGDSEAAIKRSVSLTPEQVTSLSEAMRDSFVIRHTPSNPRLLLSPDTYTGVGEAIGAQRVTDLLRTVGRNVVLKRSRTVSAEDLKNHPVILLGSVWSNEWSGKLPLAEDFIYTGQATIENHAPAPGERSLYRSRFEEPTGKLVEDYALITVKPNITEDNVIMILSGLRSAGTEAAAEFATGRNFLRELNQELRKIGSPRYYQALLQLGVENGVPTTIQLLSIHKLGVK